RCRARAYCRWRSIRSRPSSPPTTWSGPGTAAAASCRRICGGGSRASRPRPRWRRSVPPLPPPPPPPCPPPPRSGRRPPPAAAPVDAVLSNPPYIPPDAVPRDAEVREHDPHRALFGGGHDGLEVPRAVLAWARHLLRPGGVLIMEHADVQGEGTRSAAAELGGFDLLRTVPDLTGRDRFLVARRAPGEPTSGSERLSR